MAFDKVVDSSVLDAGLKQIADAIREKGGTTGNLEFPAEMAEAITSIEAGGGELPTLDRPATEADVVGGMEFIGADGTAKKGTMPALFIGGISEVNENSVIEEYDGRKRIFLGGNTINSQTSYVYPGYDIAVYMYDTDEKMSMFGDAKPEDVAAGKTFTSKEGFTKVGTHACSGGGVELPTLEYPATEADVVSSKQFIDENGNLRTGSMGLLGFGGIVDADEDVEIAENDDGSKTLVVGGYTKNTETKRVDPDTALIVMMDETNEGMSVFGNAKPEDVAEGKTFTSKEGFTKIGTHVCTGGTGSKPIILSVEKITSDTYVSSTSYTGEQFILLDIYPKSGGTVTVTYGDLTKTIVDDGTSETPPAQQVFFGTFGGVADEVETPSSGGLVIDGDYAAFGIGEYRKTSKSSVVCGCITDVVDFGTMDYIPDNAFGTSLMGGCKKLKHINLPYNLKSIGEGAFAECGLEYLAIPYGITILPPLLATRCNDLRDVIIPSSVTTLDESAISMNKLKFVTIPESVTYLGIFAIDVGPTLQYIRILATTPPTVDEDFLDLEYSKNFVAFIVPAGCGEAYKTAEGWSAYADYIMEDAETEAAG